jgi:hypothetical protein
VQPVYDAGIERGLRDFFHHYSTVSFDNYPIAALRDEPRPLDGGR